ncbi:sensor histidine kinase [Georgenia sp. SYP-B2076]|uniref:sensor histidine kinase n=1 Tax=Georgenia sp. SYP-B2076 TaxID=2495881 RepID=UPI000F8C9666|nr:sensor histidine kinase [Georgenia sp. SYP-B2076]
MTRTSGVRARLRDPASRRTTVDSLVALAVVLLLGVPTVAAVRHATGAGTAFVVTGSILMPAALAWRRSHPVAAAVTIYACALAHVVVSAALLAAGSVPLLLPVDVLVLVALYSVTVYGPPWARRAGLVGALAGAVLLALIMAAPMGRTFWVTFLLVLLGVSGCVLATWGAAQVRRGRMERLESLIERARRLETERDQQAQIATAAERTRIAREMHDVVAHSLSVVIAQADGGRYAARSDPGAAERALTTIAEMGRDALADIRRILGVLRDGDPSEGATLLPQPVDADLDALVEQVRSSGAAVSVVRMGTPRPLPPGAGLTIYRICQEALTNALKHAGPGARTTVLLQWLPGSMTVQVDDDGRGAAAADDGKGHGLVGMRERAALFGSSVQAGPRAGGGFRVRVQLPLPDVGPTHPARPGVAPDPARPQPPAPHARALPARAPDSPEGPR